MKILFLSQLFPLPADSGGKIKSLCMLRALASEHDVCLLAYVRNKAEQESVEDLRRMCRFVEVVPFVRSRFADFRQALSSLFFRRSFIVTRDFRREMLNRFQQVVRDFVPDIVHIDHLQMAQFVDFDGPYRTVLDQHNVESTIVKRIAETSTNPLMRAYAGIEWPKLFEYEIEICRKSDLVIAVSEEDAETLRRMISPDLSSVRRGEMKTFSGSYLARRGIVECVPIGVDVNSIPVVQRVENSKNILFLGTMYWPPNIDCVLYFHSKILPIVRSKLPDCVFTIAGQKPPRAVRRLACESGIRVTGYVRDARELAANCGVFVVPLRSGSGVRVKILGALAMGLPVVSTSIGAEGLKVAHGEHILIADSPEDFAKAVIDVLNDPNLARELGRKGRELVEREYSWEVVGSRLLSLYSDCWGQTT
ncbi:MAG: glycosyltransferase family 4 protein [Armatimonadetes bacterium]|nr:glycosyltransferase family 4 protein [Armatimonadota bacterium]